MKTRDKGNDYDPCLLRGITISLSSSRSEPNSSMPIIHQQSIVNHLGHNNQPLSNLKYLGHHDRNLTYSLLFIIFFYFMIHYVSCQFYDPPTNLQYFRSSSNKRRWIITGNFTSITVNNKTQTYTNLNNIAVWNGNTWKGLGNGTNGLVRTQFVDSCYNMYVGGDFSVAGSLSTGPIARWSISKQRWESITDDVVWGKESKVHSISVDCYNTPAEASRCYCNVWVGGSFELKIANSTFNATNIAMYQSNTNTWHSLADTNRHNLTSAMTVRTVFKKDFGQTFRSRKSFVGGDFPFLLTWDPYYKIWERIEMGNSTNQAVVKQIHFHKGILDTSLFSFWNYIVAGDFEFFVNNTDTNTTFTCKNLCLLHFRDGTWIPALTDGSVLHGSVEHVSTSDGNLVAVGNFSKDGISNLVSVTEDGIDNTRFNSSLIDQPFTSVYVCKETDLECTPKSAGLVDGNGGVWFYDSETGSFIEFGRVNYGGVVASINSIFMYGIANKL